MEIKSPVLNIEGWGQDISGLQFRKISFGDLVSTIELFIVETRYFLTKSILSPVPKNQLWRSGLHNRIIYFGDKIFFD